ncbi:iron-siderophore ABC transporter substrate-binding protein [Solihabitans fulvus]|uniref:Iron-siderophore ABC transporter substrate-binding protein n=1 Tax=Solihabitans fulvus TaxID=1892852 RepID=A0A5B2XHF7_9PSEU|nr:iron-siderophore ABC transporter substrate-binding protein [Solihabitans fulvus]KAA2262321.1 iron-siderophore ABC transporter substrate-binding protein [Solihabitans fulvus]
MRSTPHPRRRAARRALAVAAVAAATLGLAACGQSGSGSAPAPTSAGGAATGAFPRTIEHAKGSTTIDKAPQRVAALDTSLVDDTIALETPVVAFTRYPGFGDSLPDYLGEDGKKYGKDAKPVGELANPKVEEIAGIAPDLIVSSSVRHEAIYDQLQKAGPTVFTKTVGVTWKENIRLLGKALGKEDLAEKKITAYEARAKKIGDAIRAKAGKNPTVSLARFVGGEPNVRLYTAKSFPGIVLDDTGLARPTGQPTSDKISVNLSQEQITSLDADRVFLATWADGKGASQQVRDQFQANPLWGQLKGQRQDVNDATWISSGSLQGAGAMLDDLAKSFGVDAGH